MHDLVDEAQGAIKGEGGECGGGEHRRAPGLREQGRGQCAPCKQAGDGEVQPEHDRVGIKQVAHQRALQRARGVRAGSAGRRGAQGAWLKQIAQGIAGGRD